jgi:nuclear GTP-binding protein
LTDWNGGKIPFYTIPPSSKKSHIEASVVSNWGQAIDLDLASADAVLSGLKSTTDFSSSVVMVCKSYLIIYLFFILNLTLFAYLS